MRQRLRQIPDLEPRAARDEQRCAADRTAGTHHRRKLEHPVGGERRFADEAVEPPEPMMILDAARRLGEPLGNLELALHDIDPVERDETRRFLVQADQQEFIDTARPRGLEEAPRQHQLAPRRHFAERAPNIHFVHHLIPRLSAAMVNAACGSVGIS